MSRTKRRTLTIESFYDHTGIEAMLERRAAQGWLLESVSNFGWVFQKAEPQKVRYAVTYYPRASEFDPEPSEPQREFQDLCAHAGWEYVANWAQMTIFVNRREDPTPIETDPVLELENMHRAMKKNYFIGQFLLLAVGLLQGTLFVSRLLGDPVGVLCSAANLFSGLCWVLILVITGAELIGYFLWRRKALRAAERGEFLPSHSHKPLQLTCLCLLLVGLAWWLAGIAAAGDMTQVAIAAAAFLAVGLPILAINGLKKQLKRKKVSAGVNRAVTLTLCMVLPIVTPGAVAWGFIRLADHGVLRKPQPAEVSLPIEELIDVPADKYTRTHTGESSILLSRHETWQHVRLSDGGDLPDRPDLWYRVTVVRVPFLYELCKDAILHHKSYEGSEFESKDPAFWGAEEVWKSAVRNGYILCYPDRIVEIRFGWGPTADQAAIVGETLGGISK